MKLHFCLLLSCFLCSVSGAAQGGRVVEVTYERSSKGEVTFYAENLSYTPYTVSLVFTKLSGTSANVGDTRDVLVNRGKTRIMTLRPTSDNIGVGFSYRYTTSIGNYRAKTDTNFVYLFPLVEGKQVRMNRLVSLKNVLGSEKKSQITGVSFRTTDGDTIVAARGGLVVEIRDNSASTSEHKAFDATENYVMILHADGSFGRYLLFRDNGIFVSPGDEVIPGQPLGTIGGSNYAGGSHLRFSLYCPNMKDFSFIPCFYLSQGKTEKPIVGELYVSEHPEEYIMLEMSKKEKKKYLEK